MISDILKGISAYTKVFQLIRKHSLGRYLFIPILLSFVLALLTGGVTWWLYDDLSNWILVLLGKIGEFSVATKAINIVSAIIITLLFILIFKHLLLAISSPFMSLLSERIEKKLNNMESEVPFSTDRFIREMLRGFRLAIRNIIREMGLSFILMILGFFPLFSPISGIMIFLIQSYYAGFGSMDYTMERHLDVKHSIRFIHQNRGLTLGIGIVFMLILMIPVLGILLVLPLSTIAGTKVTLDRLEKLKD